MAIIRHPVGEGYYCQRVRVPRWTHEIGERSKGPGVETSEFPNRPGESLRKVDIITRRFDERFDATVTEGIPSCRGFRFVPFP